MYRLLICIVLFCINALPASACSCMGKSAVKDEIKRSDAVITGTIVNKEIVTFIDSSMIKMFPNDTSIRNSPMSKRRLTRYDLLVESVYKGKITRDTLSVYTGMGGGDCGFRFVTGEKYIIYAYYGDYNGVSDSQGQKGYWTNICSRTARYSEPEITEIEKLKKKKR